MKFIVRDIFNNFTKKYRYTKYRNIKKLTKKCENYRYRCPGFALKILYKCI